jgi:hypothetical protein
MNHVALNAISSLRLEVDLRFYERGFVVNGLARIGGSLATRTNNPAMLERFSGH